MNSVTSLQRNLMFVDDNDNDNDNDNDDDIVKEQIVQCHSFDTKQINYKFEFESTLDFKPNVTKYYSP